MCLNPVTILNPTKYVSVRYRDRFLLQTPCGRCSECMTNKSNEWNFRLYQQSLETFSKKGFVYYVTLTYNNQSLPHISDYFQVSKEVDFPCFRSEDLRLFVARLRQACKRKFNSNFDYFIASEYGTSEKCTHRPHYHAVFFVTGSVSNLQFSNLVGLHWKHGRTDGFPYKSSYYIDHNTFKESSSGSLAALRYITKYIQKSCEFQREITHRVSLILEYVTKKFASQGLEKWEESSHYWRFRDKLFRHFNQFHRQSTHLGEWYLSKLNVSELFDSPFVYMPDSKDVVKKIPLPTYYKRKLFYQLVEQDGAKIWTPTTIGWQFLEYRLQKVVESLAHRFRSIAQHINLKYDFTELAKYVLLFRGRFVADFTSELAERVQTADFYAYLNRYDKEFFGEIGLCMKWCGNSSTRYYKRAEFIPVGNFIHRFVYMRKDLEEILDKLYSFTSSLSAGKQRAYEEKQRISNILHYLIKS